MDAGFFIYIPRDISHNIYFKVFDGQDKLPVPPPFRINCSSPNEKETSFNHSPIVPTTILNTQPCPTGFNRAYSI